MALQGIPINEDDCIGDSLDVINTAFLNLDNNIADVKVKIAGVAAEVDKIVLDQNYIGNWVKSPTDAGTPAGNGRFLKHNSATDSWVFDTNIYSAINSSVVGIGTTSPAAKLHINSTASNTPALIVDSTDSLANMEIRGASGGSIDFKKTGSPLDYIVRLQSEGSGDINGGGALKVLGNYFDIAAGSSTSALLSLMRLTNTSGGRVGIGTTDPQYKLHVEGDTYVNGLGMFSSGIKIIGSTGSIGVSSIGTGSIIEQRSNGTEGDAAYMAFNRVGSQGVRFGLDVDNYLKIGGWSLGNNSYRIVHEGLVNPSLSGRVLANGMDITQASGSATIELKGTTGSYIDLAPSVSEDYNLRLASWPTENAVVSINNGLYVYTGGTSVAPTFNTVFTPTGRVGIGTTSPQSKLHVDGVLTLGRQTSEDEGAEISFARSTDNTEYFRLDTYGSSADPRFRLISPYGEVFTASRNATDGVRVGFNRTSPRCAVDIQGTCFATILSADTIYASNVVYDAPAVNELVLQNLTVNDAATFNSSTVNAKFLNLTNSTGYAGVEAKGLSGSYVDLTGPHNDSADYDLRLIHENGSAVPSRLQSVHNFGIFTGLNVNSQTLQFVVTTTGNIGIGTSNPTSKLHVNGSTVLADLTASTLNVPGNSFLTALSTSSLSAATLTASTLTANALSATNLTVRGSTILLSGLQVFGDAGIFANRGTISSLTVSNSLSVTGNTYIAALTATGGAFLNGVISVGRQDSNQEGGQINLRRASDNSDSIGLDLLGNTDDPRFRVYSINRSAEIFTAQHIVGEGSRFGIGISAPQATLDVNGTVKARSTISVDDPSTGDNFLRLSQNRIIAFSNVNSRAELQINTYSHSSPSNSQFRDFALYDGKGGLILKGIGNGTSSRVGINKADPQATCHVGGDLTVDGNLVVNGKNLNQLPDGVPIGTVTWLATDSVPLGYLKCDGTAYSKTEYPALFAKIGNTFATTGGLPAPASTAFRVPDLRSEFIRGWDNGRGVDSGRTLGSNQSGAFESHSHNIDTVGSTYNGGFNAIWLSRTTRVAQGFNPEIQNTAFVNAMVNGNQLTNATGANETRPRNVALMPCIKAYNPEEAIELQSTLNLTQYATQSWVELNFPNNTELTTTLQPYAKLSAVDTIETIKIFRVNTDDKFNTYINGVQVIDDGKGAGVDRIYEWKYLTSESRYGSRWYFNSTPNSVSYATRLGVYIPGKTSRMTLVVNNDGGGPRSFKFATSQSYIEVTTTQGRTYTKTAGQTMFKNNSTVTLTPGVDLPLAILIDTGAEGDKVISFVNDTIGNLATAVWT